MSKVTYKGGKPIGPQRVKQKSNWWRYLLTWFAGFLSVPIILGIAVAIIGFSMSAKDLINMFGGNANDILQPEYQNYSLFDLISALPNQKYETLGDIDKVTPAVRNLIEKEINPSLKESVHFEFDWEEMKNKPFKLNPNSTRPESEYDHTTDLVSYIPTALEKGIKIASFFTDEETGEIKADGMTKYIVYPIIYDEATDTYSVDTESGDLVSLYDILSDGDKFFDNIQNALVIGDVINTEGSEFLQQIAGWTLAQFSDEDNIKSLKIGSLVSGSGAFMEQLAECSIGELTDEYIRGLEIGLLFDDVSEDNVLINTIKSEHWSINDLTNMDNFYDLKLEQVINTSDSSDFIKTLGGYKLSAIMEPTFIDGLELKEIFPEATGVLGALADMTYEDEEGEHPYTIGDLQNNDRVLKLKISDVFPDLAEGDLLYSFRNDKLSDINDKDIKTILVKDLFTDYSSYRILKAVVDLKGEDVATIGDLTDQETINQLPLTSVVDTNGNQVLEALVNRGATIGTMSDVVSQLTMKEVIDIGDDENAMVYKIAHSEVMENCPITEIGTQFPYLKLSDVFTIDENSPQVLKALVAKGATLNSLSDDMTNLTINDVMEIYPGDIYKRTIGENLFEYYLFTNDGWGLIDDTELDEELSAYYDVKDGYIPSGRAVEYTGTDVPDSTMESLEDAIARDPLYPVGNTKINNSAEMITALKNNLTLKDVVDIDENSPQVLQTLQHTKLVNIADALGSLTLSQIIHIDSTSSNIIALLADVTVFGDGNNNLQHALENLNIIDLFGSEAYATGEKASSRNGIKISFTPNKNDFDDETGELKPDSEAVKLGNFTVNNSGKLDNYFIHDKGNNVYFYNYLYSTDEYNATHIDNAVKQGYSFVTGMTYDGEETFDENNNSLTIFVNGYDVTIESVQRHKFDMIYWFMFTQSDEVYSSEDQFYILKNGYTYSVNSMGHFTDNIVYHIQNESLETLYIAGLITTAFDFDAVLNEYIVVGGVAVAIPHGGTRVGDLTINELIDVINALLPYISTSA